MAHNAMDPRFHAIIAAHAPVRPLGTGFTFTEWP